MVATFLRLGYLTAVVLLICGGLFLAIALPVDRRRWRLNGRARFDTLGVVKR